MPAHSSILLPTRIAPQPGLPCILATLARLAAAGPPCYHSCPPPAGSPCAAAQARRPPAAAAASPAAGRSLPRKAAPLCALWSSRWRAGTWWALAPAQQQRAARRRIPARPARPRPSCRRVRVRRPRCAGPTGRSGIPASGRLPPAVCVARVFCVCVLRVCGASVRARSCGRGWVSRLLPIRARPRCTLQLIITCSATPAQPPSSAWHSAVPRPALFTNNTPCHAGAAAQLGAGVSTRGGRPCRHPPGQVHSARAY